MAKSWADMTKEERQATGKSKKEYNQSTGHRAEVIASKELNNNPTTTQPDSSGSNRAEAKERAATHTNNTAASRVAAQNGYKTTGGSKRPEGTTYVPGKGYVEAPSWYRNSKGQIPSTMSASDYSGGEEKYKQMQAIQQRKEAKRAAERAPKEAAYAARQERRDDAEAYRQSREDLKTFRESSSGGLERKVDQRSHYEHLMNKKGGYGGNAAHNAAVEQLMSTGQGFTHLDVQREMGSSSTHNLDGLYKAYGGIENYQKNHSVGSGNFKAQEGLTTMKGADDAQRKHFAEKRDFLNNDFMKKYGQYDWAQKQVNQFNTQADRFTKSFDKRMERMQNSGEGSVYGY